MNGYELANGEEEVTSGRDAQASGCHTPGFVLFGRVMQGLNQEEVPIGSILVDIELPGSHARLFVGLITESDELKEFFVLPGGDAIDFHLAFRH